MNQQQMEIIRALDTAIEAVKAFGGMLDTVEESAEQKLHKQAA